jgi:hypothetical protein
LDFLRKSRIVSMIYCLYVLTITAGAVIGLPMALNYSLVDWLLFGIFVCELSSAALKLSFCNL